MSRSHFFPNYIGVKEFKLCNEEDTLLALGPYKGLIFVDYEECFISVNVLLGSEEGMTEEDLQELADPIDLRILKDVQVPDMRGDSD